MERINTAYLQDKLLDLEEELTYRFNKQFNEVLSADSILERPEEYNDFVDTFEIELKEWIELLELKRKLGHLFGLVTLTNEDDEEKYPNEVMFRNKRYFF